jgi:hypothetical protein
MAARSTIMAPASSVLGYNLALAVATIISASSYEVSLPAAYLLDPLPSKRWRSKLGWNIVAGFNDKIDFNRAGVKVATIAPGNYATGALLAVAIVAAFEAADATPVWACTYSTTTKKFTISSDIAFTLLFGTGANVGIGASPKGLGFALADTGSAVTQTGGSAVYHSVEYLLFDLGSALAATLGIAHGHNMGSGGTVTLYGKTTATPWTSPGTTQVLVGDDLTNKRVLLFGTQSFRYWALVFDDPGNTAGYTELGVPYIGTYWTPGRGYQPAAQRQGVPLSTPMRADQGALYILARQSPKQHRVRYQGLSLSDRNTYQAIEDAHGHIFFMKWPENYPGSETVYGVITDTASVDDHGPLGDLFSFDVMVDENLG